MLLATASFLLLLLLVGCGIEAGSTRSDCELYAGKSWPAYYIGALSGEGFIELTNLTGPINQADILIIVNQPSGESTLADQQTVIRVTGTATCDGSKLSAHFGASAGQNDVFKIVGGKMAGELNPPSGFDPFGVWQIQLVHLESLEIYQVAGAWGIYSENPLKQ